MGGSASAELDRDTLAEVYWLVKHSDGELGSPWGHFVIQRYGPGIAATGLASSTAVPRLCRKRVQDWDVRGCSVHLGPDFVSFGRQLSSASYSETDFFYGIDVCFGQHPQSSWLWYCHPQVWLLKLHRAILEELPVLPDPSAVTVTASSTSTPLRSLSEINRFPGRPRWLGDAPPESARATAGTAPSLASGCGEASLKPCEDARGVATKLQSSEGIGAGGDATDSSTASASGQTATDAASQDFAEECVSHQLKLFLGNSEGHPGVLCLPVTRACREQAEALVSRWEELQVPLDWSGRRWETADDFRRLHDEALVMSDLLLLGLDLELAEALTPDWTWEVYARGFGEVAFSNSEEVRPVNPSPPELTDGHSDASDESSHGTLAFEERRAETSAS